MEDLFFLEDDNFCFLVLTFFLESFLFLLVWEPPLTPCKFCDVDSDSGIIVNADDCDSGIIVNADDCDSDVVNAGDGSGDAIDSDDGTIDDSNLDAGGAIVVNASDSCVFNAFLLVVSFCIFASSILNLAYSSNLFRSSSSSLIGKSLLFNCLLILLSDKLLIFV